MENSLKSSLSYRGWLDYQNYRLTEKNQRFRAFCHFIQIPKETGSVLNSAVREWKQAAKEIYGVRPQVTECDPACPHIVIRTDTEKLNFPVKSRFRIFLDGSGTHLNIVGSDESATLYGVFALLRAIGTGKSPEEAQTLEESRNSLRMIDHWDNLDGSIERGYAGRSLFFRSGHVLKNKDRITDYARMLASVGINALSLNNVNVFPPSVSLISKKYLPAVSNIAKIFSSYGIRTFLSVSFASPMELGGLKTADPLDIKVIKWWAEKVNEIYRYIPDFGGFLVKADSESRPGPHTYGRSHDQGANLLADALSSHGGLVIWRCFVYDCQMDWRDRSKDRAKMAYENFAPLDGKFHKNVLLQIKNGPMDFQIREPVSPLFGVMRSTNVVMECQITQEYTGQQIDLCYLVPIWKEALDFDTRTDGKRSPVSRIVDGSRFGNLLGGMAGVSNVGDSAAWTGHPLAQANLFGFGRLSWNPDLTSEAIAREWSRMTFGTLTKEAEIVESMLLRSREIYENYTSPLGIGWFVNPGSHYGPNVDGYEYSRWGTYHRADCKGIGMDRTIQTGSGFTAQYFPPVEAIYENPKTCPEKLILFFHHLPYSWHLRDGRTLIQYIYDSHFEGYVEAEQLKRSWLSLNGHIDPEIFSEVLQRLNLQVQNAREWRDVVNTYFFRKTGIPDKKGRKIYP